MRTPFLLMLATYYYFSLLLGGRPGQPAEIQSYIQKKSLLKISNSEQFQKVFRRLRSLAQICSAKSVCFDTSLVMGRLTDYPLTLHFSIEHSNELYRGHAWLEAFQTTYTTDLQFKEVPLYTIRKTATLGKTSDVHPEV